MGVSLYDISVTQFLQTLGALSGVLDKGAKFSAEKGVDLTEIVDSRVHPTMLPFSFQVVSAVHHSKGCIAAMKSGKATPPGPAPEGGYAALQGLVTDAIASLKDEKPDEINALAGKDVLFQLGENFKLPFTAEGFLTSFELPNFYFHSSMAYGILRGHGVELGKRDFMGAMRLKR